MLYKEVIADEIIFSGTYTRYNISYGFHHKGSVTALGQKAVTNSL